LAAVYDELNSGSWDGKAFEPPDSPEIILIAHNS